MTATFETSIETRVSLTIDGQAVEVPEGTSIHKACESAGVDTPTLCWAENLTPVNVCRVCVVEVEGQRALVPSCARPAEEGMVVETDSDRVRHSRKMVLEFLGSGVELAPARVHHTVVHLGVFASSSRGRRVRGVSRDATNVLAPAMEKKEGAPETLSMRAASCPAIPTRPGSMTKSMVCNSRKTAVPITQANSQNFCSAPTVAVIMAA